MHKYHKINYYIDIFCNFAAGSKNTNEKKLTKHYFDKCSSGVLFPKSILNASRIKSLLVFTFLLSLTFFTHINAQESIITGLENIHISEGTTIIEKKSNKDIIAITSNGTQKIINSEKNNSDKKELIAKGKDTLKNKIAKTSIEKIIKTKKISNPIIVFNGISSSESSFHASGCNLKQINTNQNNYDSKFINSESNWIEYLYVVEVKQGVLFQIYISKNTKDSFFTRPPPNSLI